MWGHTIPIQSYLGEVRAVVTPQIKKQQKSDTRQECRFHRLYKNYWKLVTK